MTTTYPTRGQKAPDYWDGQLKAYIDEGDAVVPSFDVIAETANAKKMTPTERAKLAGVQDNATANAADADLRDRATHTGTESADVLTDGATNKAYTATERTKLAGVAANATANATDAALRDRATHTGTQTSVSISDFQEAVEDAVAALLGRSTMTGITWTYNDATGHMDATVTGGGGGGLDAEGARDAIGAALVGVGVVSVVANDALDTITISSTATANSTDAALRDRSTHTGTQSADTIVDGATNKAYTAAEKTKLAGVAANSTSNDTDANLKNRANHTGVQAISTVTGLQAALDAKRDAGALVVDDMPAGYTVVVIASGTTWPSPASSRTDFNYRFLGSDEAHPPTPVSGALSNRWERDSA